jgi:hypothetical protein
MKAPILRSAQRVPQDGGFRFCASLVLALITLLFSPSLIFAQPSMVECSNAAAPELPKQIATWAKLECTALEQKIGPADGWAWRHFPSLRFDGISSGSGSRFIHISYEVMNEETKDKLTGQFPKFAIPKKLKEKDVYLLTAKTNTLSEFKFMVTWPEPILAYMYDLTKLPAEDTIVVSDRVEMRKKIERLRQGEKY